MSASATASIPSGNPGAAPVFKGPIFDGDTHLYETPDAFSRYLPEKFKKDWGYHWKVGDDGEYALYVGKQKVEVSAGYTAADGRVPPPGKGGPSEKTLRETAERALATHDESAAKLNFADALGAIFGVVEEANKHFQRTQPWQAVKEPSRKGEVEASLFAGLEAVRVVAYLLFPYMPTISPRIAEVLGVESPATAKWEAVARWGLLQPGKQIHSAPLLFPRLERAKTA